MTFIIVAMVVLSTETGQENGLIGISTAVLRAERLTVTAVRIMTAAGSLIMTARGDVMAAGRMSMAGFAAMMLRMYVCTGHSFGESRNEGTARSLAGVHVETYDTHTVPYDEQHSAYFHPNSFHLPANQPCPHRTPSCKITNFLPNHKKSYNFQ